MSSPSVTKALLVCLFIEGAAWGIQLVTFIFSVWTLTKRARASKRRLVNPIFIYPFCLFAIGTLDVSFLLRQTLQVFDCEGEGANTVSNQPSNYVLVLRVGSLRALSVHEGN